MRTDSLVQGGRSPLVAEPEAKAACEFSITERWLYASSCTCLSPACCLLHLPSASPPPPAHLSWLFLCSTKLLSLFLKCHSMFQHFLLLLSLSICNSCSTSFIQLWLQPIRLDFHHLCLWILYQFQEHGRWLEQHWAGKFSRVWFYWNSIKHQEVEEISNVLKWKCITTFPKDTVYHS